MSKKVKIFAIVALALALIIWGISKFSGNGTPAASTSGQPLSSSVLPAGVGSGTSKPSASANEFALLLASINSIDIDLSVFSNPAYRTLRDYPVVLGSDVVGRSNPFAAIGNDSGSVVLPIQVQTLQPGKISATAAEFGAQVTINDGVPALVFFEYGTSDVFGSMTSAQTVTKSGTVLVPVTTLTPNTNYIVHAIVTRGSSITGNTMPFMTLAAQPKR